MSKFSSSFMYKSPLNGAYESGADGLAFMGSTISGQKHFNKLQSDIVSAVDKSYNKGVSCPATQKLVQGVCIMKTSEELGDEEKDSATNMLGKCPKGKVRSKINKKCVSKKGAGKEYDK